jgi:hypothetical protein
MNKKQILVVSNQDPGNHLSNWARNSEIFDFTFAHTDEKAIEIAHLRPFDMVCVDGTDEHIDLKKLQAVLPILQEDVALMQYKGESVDEIGNKVKAVFHRRRNERIKRFMVLDSSETGMWKGLPPFSTN